MFVFLGSDLGNCVGEGTGPSLRRILAAYSFYYKRTRTHLALKKNAQFERAVQRIGSVIAVPVLGGLHHQYVRTYRKGDGLIGKATVDRREIPTPIGAIPR